MNPIAYKIWFSFFCLTLFLSCRNNREDSQLLQKQDYKLWQIVDDKKTDSVEWINVGNLKLESSWEEEPVVWKNGYGWSGLTYDGNYDYIVYNNFIEPVKWPRFFKKKGVMPEFLYFDSDGYACIVYFDRQAGNFFEKQDTEMSGKWKIKNDSILTINNNSFLYKQTGKNPATLTISNLNTGKTIQVVDSRIPYVCGHQIAWTEEAEKSHRKKWGFGIKASPLLQGNNSKLWREENRINRCEINYDNPFVDRGKEFFERSYYCRNLMYFDKYGRYADLDFTGLDWRMSENNYPSGIVEMIRDFVITSWYPNGNDSTFCGYNTYSISYTHPDTLNLRNVETGETIRYIAINLPLKSKWKESRKR